jgi:hypothetical protein
LVFGTTWNTEQIKLRLKGRIDRDFNEKSLRKEPSTLYESHDRKLNFELKTKVQTQPPSLVQIAGVENLI